MTSKHSSKPQTTIVQQPAVPPNNLLVKSTEATTTKRALPTFKSDCHTHGTTLSCKANKVNSSTTCRKPSPYHKTTVTATNKQGGSNQKWIVNIVKVIQALRLETSTVSTFKALELEQSVTPDVLVTLIQNAVDQMWKNNERKPDVNRKKNSNWGALKPPPDSASLNQPSNLWKNTMHMNTTMSKEEDNKVIWAGYNLFNFYGI
jgi:hypothetical protein